MKCTDKDSQHNTKDDCILLQLLRNPLLEFNWKLIIFTLSDSEKRAFKTGPLTIYGWGLIDKVLIVLKKCVF
jgi:hypothetical protein